MRSLFRRKSQTFKAGPSPVAEARSDKPDLRARRAFLAEHMLVHTPIPKAGGSTLSDGFAGIAGSVQSIRAAFGVPWARIPRLNISSGNETAVRPEMRDRPLQTNALDAELYHHLADSFDRRLQNACDYIASRCLLPLKDANTENEDRT